MLHQAEIMDEAAVERALMRISIKLLKRTTASRAFASLASARAAFR